MMTPSDELLGLLAELREILEEERRVLLSGSPERISDLVERKLLLAEMVEKQSKMPEMALPNLEMVTWLDRYNRGNSVICSAMLRQLTGTIDKLRRHDLHRSYRADGAETSPTTQNPLGAA
jgi:flagellar biosynthesis/type III secretory pathway chaperone